MHRHSINISETDIKLIEKDTQKQSKGACFYHHRAGRIGASISKLACHTNPAQPSQSLIKAICYPNLFKFSTAATEHGCRHEDQAIETFENFMRKKRIGYRTIKCGVFINKQFPWLHATPDFLSWCKCPGGHSTVKNTGGGLLNSLGSEILVGKDILGFFKKTDLDNS